MTLEEAIKVKQIYHNCNSQHMTPEERKADNLSIEALKRCRTLGQESPLWALHPLPSETKD